VIRLAAVLTFLVVAGCSTEQKAEEPTSSPSNDQSSFVQGDAQGNVPVPSPTATKRGTNVRAVISTLHADVSGLNVRSTELGTIVDLPADTLFAFDSFDLAETAPGNLKKVAELIRSAPPGDIQIVGHTDGKGSTTYNQELSERRARSVAEWMGEQVGVRQRHFHVTGKGTTVPLAPNQKPDGSDDPVGRAKNRRVEITIPS
jgi:outer membrane protein OmpA-like peptidoglycan-associated protein